MERFRLVVQPGPVATTLNVWDWMNCSALVDTVTLAEAADGVYGRPGALGPLEVWVIVRLVAPSALR